MRAPGPGQQSGSARSAAEGLVVKVLAAVDDASLRPWGPRGPLEGGGNSRRRVGLVSRYQYEPAERFWALGVPGGANRHLVPVATNTTLLLLDLHENGRLAVKCRHGLGLPPHLLHILPSATYSQAGVVMVASKQSSQVWCFPFGPAHTALSPKPLASAPESRRHVAGVGSPAADANRKGDGYKGQRGGQDGDAYVSPGLSPVKSTPVRRQEERQVNFVPDGFPKEQTEQHETPGVANAAIKMGGLPFALPLPHVSAGVLRWEEEQRGPSEMEYLLRIASNRKFFQQQQLRLQRARGRAPAGAENRQRKRAKRFEAVLRAQLHNSAAATTAANSSNSGSGSMVGGGVAVCAGLAAVALTAGVTKRRAGSSCGKGTGVGVASAEEEPAQAGMHHHVQEFALVQLTSKGAVLCQRYMLGIGSDGSPGSLPHGSCTPLGLPEEVVGVAVAGPAASGAGATHSSPKVAGTSRTPSRRPKARRKQAVGREGVASRAPEEAEARACHSVSAIRSCIHQPPARALVLFDLYEHCGRA
eukprot:jgi/Mesen1/259/ME1144413C09489